VNQAITNQVNTAKKNRKRRGIWRRIVTSLACVVVFCTVYALILPAITMKTEVFCGKEEHTHTAECFTMDQIRTLICSAEHLNLHVHDEDCYNEAGDLSCTIADYVAHIHDDSCLDETGVIVCPLPELIAHVHNESCYAMPESTSEPVLHVHGDLCVQKTQGDLVCGIEETAGHQHSDNCRAPGDNLICTKTENHQHAEGCFEYPLICQDETAEHEHAPECYSGEATLICQLDEMHAHTQDCYESVLICELPEVEAHTHSDDCYHWVETIICGMEEGQPEPTEAPEPILICKINIPETHVHSETCFETHFDGCTEEHVHTTDCAGWHLSCQLEEHQHHLICYSDPDADVETAAVWEKVLEQVELSGDSRKDLLAVAQTQLGYCESTKNYVVDEDQTTRGYTRYGDWYGDDYGHWCAMFVSFCMNYADIDDIPYHSNVAAWIDDLTELEQYRLAGEYTPIPGDLIFFDFDADGIADHVGIVQELIDATETEKARIKTIEGNNYDQVKYASYEADNAGIIGFAVLPENLSAEELSQLDNVRTLIDGLPDQSEIDERLAEFEANSEFEQRDLWYGELTATVKSVYAQYQTLSEDQLKYLHNAQKLLDMEPIWSAEDAPAELFCATEEHAHEAGCYDEAGNLICGREEHVHTPICELVETDAAQVKAVIAAIDAMPSSDEIDAAVAQFQEQGDEDGEIAYLEQVFPQVQQVYLQYAALGEELQQYVTNADKLLALEYIWSAATLDMGGTFSICQINCYANDNAEPALFIGGSLSKFTQYNLEHWMEVMVELDNEGFYRVTSIIPNSPPVDKSSHTPSTNGFMLMFHDTGKLGLPIVSVNDYVTVSTVIPSTSQAYNSAGYLTVTFSSTPPFSLITSDTATPLRYQENGGRVAHTSEFIDLNLYNYNDKVNNLWSSTSKKYPGFQWPGGAYAYYTTYDSTNGTTYYDTRSFAGISGYRTDRHATDSVSFGDNIVADLKYADSQSAFENNTYKDSNGNTYENRYGKAPNATSVGVLSTNSNSSETGKINWLWWNGNSESITNRPAGYSTTGKAIQQKTIYNEYFNPQAPVTSEESRPLGYLFPSLQPEGVENHGVTKRNSQSIDGLFQVNPTSGLYYYNSHQNHAQFNDAADRFVLYDEIITSNFLLYPFGNFLPFNDINSETTQVGKLNYTNGAGAVDGSEDSGGMRNYVLQIIEKLKNRMHGMDYAGTNYSSRLQLKTMLEEYWEDWYLSDGASAWYNLTSGEAIKDYFLKADDGPGVDPGFSQEQLDNIYNIDWDEPTDFFFGMDMSMDIMMPKNALTGHDNGNNNEPWQVQEDGTFVRGGNKDGIPDYPMVFNFAGDDDVWVFIDGLLYLDLTGIHRHVGGTIDFETGIVYYFELLPATGDTSNNTAQANYYYAETFEQIIRRSFTDSEADQMNAMLDGLRPVLNADGTQRYFTNTATGETTAMMTFKDYTTHSFKFFYMERGSGSSVCRMNFNFPMLKQNSISVQKELTSDVNVEMLGNPDFRFQILKADENDNKLNELFIGGNVEYTIYNSVTNAAIGTGITDANGIFVLKAGQRAEFEGIQENAGKYYVRELINKEYFEQYGEISVDGIVIHDTALGQENDTFKGVDSPVKDVSNGTTVFIFDNQVTVEKLGSLSVSKNLNSYSDASDKEFLMNVSLDGKPLPVGMLYTLSDGTTVAVEEEGIIPLKGGQTATIPNVLAGTSFEIWESAASAAGYMVSYSAEDADGVTTSPNSVTGRVKLHTLAKITVTNAQEGTQIEIPVTKTFRKFVNGEYNVTFALKQTDQDGNDIDGGTQMEESFKITQGSTTVTFPAITYLSSQLTGDSMTYYYTIEETAAGPNCLPNSQRFLVEVLVTKSGNALTAEIKSVKEWNGDGYIDVTDKQVEFFNTLTSSLTVEKKLVGLGDQQEFGFIVTPTVGESGVIAVPNSYQVIYYDAKGNEQEPQTYTLSNGSLHLVLKADEKAVILGLPIGSGWTVREGTVVRNEDGSYQVTDMPPTGYLISNQIGDTTTQGKQAQGTVADDGTHVVFTNTTVYELPSTGGIGTSSYTTGGLLLMMAAVILLYIQKRRRREGV